MRPDVVLHPGDRRVEIGERPPEIIKRAAVGLGIDDVSALVAIPHLGVRLPKRYVSSGIEQERDDEDAGRTRQSWLSAGCDRPRILRNATELRRLQHGKRQARALLRFLALGRLQVLQT